VLALAVGSQTAETLVGSVGAQFRRSFVVQDRTINPYVNLTAESDLLGNGRVIQFDATSAPLIVNNWSVGAPSQHVFGRVAAGVVAPLSASVAMIFNVSQTFGREGGNDFYGNGGVRIEF
jgi:outer membrane autotransporter protein